MPARLCIATTHIPKSGLPDTPEYVQHLTDKSILATVMYRGEALWQASVGSADSYQEWTLPKSFSVPAQTEEAGLGSVGLFSPSTNPILLRWSDDNGDGMLIWIETRPR